MVTSGVLLALLAVSIALLVILAAALAAARFGHGPLYGRFVEFDHKADLFAYDNDRDEELGTAGLRGTSSLPARQGSGKRAANRTPEVWDAELNAVLRGSYAAAAVNRAIRILAWSFILIVLLIVSETDQWRDHALAIYALLIIAGGLVIVGHEVMPTSRPSTTRIVIETTITLAFITALVALTGDASSPFFFLFPLLVAGVALITQPLVAVTLTLEAAAAFSLAALAGPTSGQAGQDALVRVAIDLAAMALLTYSGMVIARVQRQTRDAAVRLSTLDPLTDLYNRAFLFNVVDREIQRGRRFRRGFCLLMMDLDGLKAINDRFGHFQGDTVLRKVAQLISEGIRSIDFASRYGGDEFVAVLPETDPSGAYVVAEKIRRSVADMVIDSGGQQIRTSLSIGVVSYPEDGQTADELMIAADEAMYSSKRLGKNKVVGYAEPSEMSEPRWPNPSVPGFRPLPRETGGPPEDRER